MKETRIAIRYAKAFFELALEQNKLEETYQDMILISNVCHENRDFRLMLISPVIHSDKKQSVLKSIFEGKVGTLVIAYLNIITAKRRESFLEPIAEQFSTLYKENKGILPVMLTTADAADDAIRSKVKDTIRKFTDKDIELIEEIKNEIIGGFILRFGQYQYDDSIQNKIMKLKREFNINIYEKGF